MYYISGETIISHKEAALEWFGVIFFKTGCYLEFQDCWSIQKGTFPIIAKFLQKGQLFLKFRTFNGKRASYLQLYALASQCYWLLGPWLTQ
jgi:hypothetical protein